MELTDDRGYMQSTMEIKKPSSLFWKASAASTKFGS